MTSSLKELFHVVYLKHKHEKENAQKGNEEGAEQTNEIEAG